MSEERFATIETKLDGLSQGLDELRGDVSELRGDVNELRGDVNELKTGQDDLRRHMGVLHEEVLERIQVLAFEPRAAAPRVQGRDLGSP